MKTSNERWFSFLGLAYRARKVISGEETVIQAVRQNKAKVVILSDDASNRTKKTISDKCRSYQVPILFVADRQVLGHAIGKAERVVVAVTDKGFGDQLIAMLDQSLRG
ncbi:ribosomal protein L7Ae-like RNA K-turn-binding protein [Pullulanibacillus pueri]|uniref:50S ribosomal protein L7ae n=1 Tax=Pullulanibacillus pueri TaxID=1437324 RepID=A0A8J2ZVU0_9BACL|nr:YlxQ family RNA-binding protein [Pullulanibacillus pueri]MBM7682517.1 ribosomal protein L7Ae-like RNA K-turn-binding protein [Pullulanibacillus pueri]GGH82084.1 50S ribosomal protein L7ae [Pullulanibacillus pueri]